jgi:hypothetical protein
MVDEPLQLARQIKQVLSMFSDFWYILQERSRLTLLDKIK